MEDNNFQSLYEQKAKFLVNLMKLSEEKRKRVMKALEFAEEAHKGQKRKNGKPYIIHPIRIANKLIEKGEDEEVIISALLHDVVEDTEKTIEEIEKEFGKEVAEIVNVLTKKKDENKESYLMRVSLNEKAKEIKVFDALDNIEDLKEIAEKKILSSDWIDSHIKYWLSIVERFGGEEEIERAKKAISRVKEILKSTQ